jgi:hypothetical protein
MKKIFKVFLVLSIVLMALGLCLCVGAFAAVGFDLAKFSMDAGELSEFDADINGNPTSDPSKVYYQKGQPKVSEETGTYYYEKLNGKEPYGK